MSKEFNEWFEKEYPQHSPDCDCDDCNKQISWEDMEKAFRGGQESGKIERYTSIMNDLRKLEKENKELKEQIEEMKCPDNCLHNKVCEIEDVCPDYCTNWKLKEGGE